MTTSRMAFNNSSSNADRDLLREQQRLQRHARTQQTESQDAPPVAVFFRDPIKVSSSHDDPLKKKIELTLGEFNEVRDAITSDAIKLIGISTRTPQPVQPHHSSYHQHRSHLHQQQQQHPPPPAFADAHKPPKPPKPPYPNGHHKAGERERERDRDRSRSNTPSGVPGSGGSSSGGSYRGGAGGRESSGSSRHHHGHPAKNHSSSTSSVDPALVAAAAGKSKSSSRDNGAPTTSQPTSFSSSSSSSSKASASTTTISLDPPLLPTPSTASLLGAPPSHLMAASATTRVSPRMDMDSRFLSAAALAASQSSVAGRDREREQRPKSSTGLLATPATSQSSSRLHPSAPGLTTASASTKASGAPPNGSFGNSGFSRSSSSSMMAAVMSVSASSSSKLNAKFPVENQMKSKKDSVDRSEVETIFQEMIFAPTPLSAIPTPKKEESKFSFPKLVNRTESTAAATQPSPRTPPAPPPPSLGKSSATSTSSTTTTVATPAASSAATAAASVCRNLDLSACASVTTTGPAAPPASAGILKDLELSDSDDDNNGAMTNKLSSSVDGCAKSPVATVCQPPEPTNLLSPASDSTSSDSDESSSGSDSEEEEEEEENNSNKSPSEASEDECLPDSAKPEANWSLDHFIQDTSLLTAPFGLPDSRPAVLSPDAASHCSTAAAPPADTNRRTKTREWSNRPDETDEELCSMELVDDDDEDDEFGRGDVSRLHNSPPPEPLESFADQRRPDADTFSRLIGESSPRITSPLSPPSPPHPSTPPDHSSTPEPPPPPPPPPTFLTKAAKKSLPEYDVSSSGRTTAGKNPSDKPTPAKRKGEPTGKPRGRPPKDPNRDKTQPAPKNGMLVKSKSSTRSTSPPVASSVAVASGKGASRSGKEAAPKKKPGRPSEKSSDRSSDKTPKSGKSKSSDRSGTGKVGRPKGSHSEKSSASSKRKEQAGSAAPSKRPPSPPGSPPAKPRQSIHDRPVVRHNSTSRSHSSSSTSSKSSRVSSTVPVRSIRSPSPRREEKVKSASSSSTHLHHSSTTSKTLSASQKLKGELVFKSKEYITTTDSDSEIDVEGKSDSPPPPVFPESTKNVSTCLARSPEETTTSSIADTIAAVLAGAGKPTSRPLTPPPPTSIKKTPSTGHLHHHHHHHSSKTHSSVAKRQRRRSLGGSCSSLASCTSDTASDVASVVGNEAKRVGGRRSRRQSEEEEQHRKTIALTPADDERKLGSRGSLGRGILSLMVSIDLTMLDRVPPYPPLPRVKSGPTNKSSSSKDRSHKSDDNVVIGRSLSNKLKHPRSSKNLDQDGRKVPPSSSQRTQSALSTASMTTTSATVVPTDDVVSKCPSESPATILPGRTGDGASKSMAPPPPAPNRVPPQPPPPTIITTGPVSPPDTSRPHKRHGQSETRKSNKKLKASTSTSLLSSSKHHGSTGSVSSMASSASTSSSKSISKTKTTPSSNDVPLKLERSSSDDRSNKERNVRLEPPQSVKVKSEPKGDECKGGITSSSKKERRTVDANKEAVPDVSVKLKEKLLGNHREKEILLPPTREDPVVEVESERCRTNDGVPPAGKGRDHSAAGASSVVVKKDAGANPSLGSTCPTPMSGLTQQQSTIGGGSSLAAPKDRSKRQSRERDCGGGRELDAKRIRNELAVPAASTSLDQSSTSSHSTFSSSFCELPKGVSEGIGRNTNHDRISASAGTATNSKSSFGHKDWKIQLDKINDELKIPSSDYFLRIAKKWKYEADKESTGAPQFLKYLRCTAYFVMTGLKMEMEHVPEKSVFMMYKNTLDLIKFVASKMRSSQNSSQQNGTMDNKLAVLSLWCQSIIYLKLYLIKRVEVVDSQRTIADYHKTPAGRANLSYQQPSPINGLLGPSAPSSLWSNKSTGTPPPMSPLPSPAGSVGSVESQSSGYSSSEIGSQSKMCGGGSASATSGVSNPSAITVATQHHSQLLSVPVHIHSTMNKTIDNLTYLSSSHDMWEQADSLIVRGHLQEFFTNLDQICGRLTLHSTPKEMVRYVMMGLVLFVDN